MPSLSIYQQALSTSEPYNVGKPADPILGYHVTGTASGLIRFMSPDFKSEDRTGWDISLSVGREDVDAATTILAQVCKEKNVKAFTVAKPEVAATLCVPEVAGQQAGKIFVLCDTGIKNLPKILSEIEKRFDEARIAPGAPIIEGTPVPGSKYHCSRRNVLDLGNKFINADKATEVAQLMGSSAANPYNKSDPLQGANLSSFAFNSEERLPDGLTAPYAASQLDSEAKLTKAGTQLLTKTRDGRDPLAEKRLPDQTTFNNYASIAREHRQFPVPDQNNAAASEADAPRALPKKSQAPILRNAF